MPSNDDQQTSSAPSPFPFDSSSSSSSLNHTHESLRLRRLPRTSRSGEKERKLNLLGTNERRSVFSLSLAFVIFYIDPVGPKELLRISIGWVPNMVSSKGKVAGDGESLTNGRKDQTRMAWRTNHRHPSFLLPPPRYIDAIDLQPRERWLTLYIYSPSALSPASLPFEPSLPPTRLSSSTRRPPLSSLPPLYPFIQPCLVLRNRYGRTNLLSPSTISQLPSRIPLNLESSSPPSSSPSSDRTLPFSS